MDLNAISDELKQIDIQLREGMLRERRALLTGYLEGSKTEHIESEKVIDELKKKLADAEFKLKNVTDVA